MAVTATRTNSELCLRALRKIGVVAIDEAATTEELNIAADALNEMLKGWQNRRLDLWFKASMSVACTTNAAYTLDPVRPLEIESVRFKQSGRETPMVQMTRREYDALPIKTTAGTPTQFYYDRQREAAQLYVWPVLSSVTTETLEITYKREVEDVVLAEVADVPGEWWDAVVYNLADRLQDDFADINAPRVTQRAQLLLQDALGYDREPSVFFAGPYSE